MFKQSVPNQILVAPNGASIYSRGRLTQGGFRPGLYSVTALRLKDRLIFLPSPIRFTADENELRLVQRVESSDSSLLPMRLKPL